MKTLAMFIAAWLSLAANAQKITEKNISFSGKESIVLDIQIADSINIRTWEKNEVYFKATVNINENKDNDAYLISAGGSGNTIKIEANFSKDYFNGRNNCCNETDIRWQVFIPEKAPFSVETINGNITITGRTAQMAVKTISGFIDLAEPAAISADLEMSTIAGSVFTNHTLTLSNRSTGFPSKIREELNSGGSPIKLETISGDIFFRKAN